MQILKGFILLALFAICYSSVVADGIPSKETFFMKNGYDPLLNMMSAANGAVQGYITQWTLEKLKNAPNEKIELTPSDGTIDPPAPEAIVVQTATTIDRGTTTTTDDSGDTDTNTDTDTSTDTDTNTDGEGGDVANAGDADFTNAGEDDEAQPSDTEGTPNDNTEPTGENPEPTGENPEPTGENTEPTGENPEPTSENPEPTGENTGDTSGTTDSSNGGAFSQAPFRVIDDGINIDSLKTDLDKLRQSIVEKASKPIVISATNEEDEKTLKQIFKEGKADAKVTELVKQRQNANIKVADPYEIAILHKIGEKVRTIQDAVKRQAVGAKQVLPPETLLLKNIVASVRSMRKRAEEQYQNAPRRVFAKDERRLRKMEKLLKKMTELMNDRSLSPKQFNKLSAIYRDKLNNLRREIH